ncbi:hypothetical protein BGZ58_005529 [Dissophora ornata]|nr:hypothetical protein BGZ58_005529 [Dissophora ornata]
MPTAIENMAPSAPVIVDMPSSGVISAGDTSRHIPPTGLVGSLEATHHEGFDPTSHHHVHEFREPSIGERFGRRHGQDWPSSRAGSNSQCVSCPATWVKPRSKSLGGRCTSGLLNRHIPPRSVIGLHVFQAALKSEQDINAMQGKQNNIIYSFEEVEEILKEHREEELAKTGLLPQLPPVRTQDMLPPATTKTDNRNLSTYGSMSVSSSGATTSISALTDPLSGTGDALTPAPSKRTYGHDNGNNSAGLDPEEGAPLIDSKRRQRTSPRLVSLAINVSFLANVFLVLIKIWAVLKSDSLAVLASMIDSLMDLLSGAIIWYSAQRRNSTSDDHRYPVGKARMEPLGIIVFASVMVTSFMQVVLQSTERLLAGSDEPPVDLGSVIMTLLGLNIIVKFALWVWCRTMKDSSSVQALAQDHLNDVIFNSFSTLFPVAGRFLGYWWLDAVGAIMLSMYIIAEWTRTCLHNIRRLTGQAANAAEIQQLTYMAYRFSNMIQAIDTVRAYYVGDGLIAEVDIVLPPETPLSLAHDLGESLQGALERLDTVERAFVHVDYNAFHAIEHR